MSPKSEDLVRGLLRRTREGEIEWEATIEKNAFQTSFPNYSIQVIQTTKTVPESAYDLFNTKAIDRVASNLLGVNNNQVVVFIVKIYNNGGDLIDEIDTNDVPENILKDLFFEVRRKALKVDQAINDILKELGLGGSGNG